ncbi:curli-like amyloid fiber formation chaperone CsgH [Roseivivax halotolerans]|uniref:curli-like amyloid fiber formation chaperone CsgH n=1 Tax=Roseivivax halotolerans TaxID=93684 RepID=UPI003CCC28F8
MSAVLAAATLQSSAASSSEDVCRIHISETGGVVGVEAYLTAQGWADGSFFFTSISQVGSNRSQNFQAGMIPSNANLLLPARLASVTLSTGPAARMEFRLQFSKGRETAECTAVFRQ